MCKRFLKPWKEWNSNKILKTGKILPYCKRLTFMSRCGICPKLIIKTPERPQWGRSEIFIVNFEHISHLFLSWEGVQWKSCSRKPRKICKKSFVIKAFSSKSPCCNGNFRSFFTEHRRHLLLTSFYFAHCLVIFNYVIKLKYFYLTVARRKFCAVNLLSIYSFDMSDVQKQSSGNVL